MSFKIVNRAKHFSTINASKINSSSVKSSTLTSTTISADNIQPKSSVLLITGLPTSSVGLAPGTLWENLGRVEVV